MIKRTNINLDARLVERAAQILGTKTTTDTVHAAMDEVVRQARLRSLAGNDLPDLTPVVLSDMRRSRAPER